MWLVIVAVATASLLGSVHCVGMCGPIAIWASGASEGRSRGQLAWFGGVYHLGRGATYLLVGLLAGTLGGMLDAGGAWIGYQLVAARIAGGTMVAVGIYKLAMLAGVPLARHSAASSSRIGAAVVKLRPLIFRLPPAARAFATGLVTTFLPCGWLYLFALVAMGTGSSLMGAIVMLAFWAGTLPALSLLVAGTRVLSQRYGRAVPAAAAGLLVVSGCYAATGRGFADPDAFARMRGALLGNASGVDGLAGTALVEQVERAGAVPLPCCQARATAAGVTGVEGCSEMPAQETTARSNPQ